MKLTENQYEALQATKMCKVVYKKMFKKEGQLGYTSIGDRYGYNINIASDAPNKTVKTVTLIHEAGHVFFKHLEENLKEELFKVKELLQIHGKSLEDLGRVYGGPMNFFNICMDLEVNSKLLTKKNIDDVKKYFELCTPESFGVPVQNHYYEYYDSLISKIEKEEEEKENPENSDNSNNEEDQKDPQESKSSDSNENSDENSSGNDNNSSNSNKNSEEDSNEETNENSSKDEKDSTEKESSENNSNETQSKNDLNSKESEQKEDKAKAAADSMRTKMQDIAAKLEADESLPKDIREALQKEDYADGNSKENKNMQIAVEESTVESEFSKELAEGELEFGKNYSTVGNSSLEAEVVENNDKNIRNFLRSIIGDNLNIRQDAMRHYNRGTRDRSNGILYNSLRRRVQLDKKKMCIIVDVSGSMNINSIMKAISTIRECNYMLDRDSKVRTWDTYLVQEFDIAKIPNNIRHGGGTDMASALRQASQDGFTDIVIYSDFETHVSSFKTAVSNCKANIYPIIVDAYNLKELERNFGDIVTKNKHLVVNSEM